MVCHVNNILVNEPVYVKNAGKAVPNASLPSSPVEKTSWTAFSTSGLGYQKNVSRSAICISRLERFRFCFLIFIVFTQRYLSVFKPRCLSFTRSLFFFVPLFVNVHFISWFSAFILNLVRKSSHCRFSPPHPIKNFSVRTFHKNMHLD